MTRTICLCIAACFLLGVPGCGAAFTKFVTPDPADKNYHCHAADGSVIADAVWCLPEDGTHTCCPFENKCSTLGGDQICEYIGRPDQPTFAKRAPTKRMPE